VLTASSLRRWQPTKRLWSLLWSWKMARSLQGVRVRFADGCVVPVEADAPVTTYECPHGSRRWTHIIFPEWTGEDGPLEDGDGESLIEAMDHGGQA